MAITLNSNLPSLFAMDQLNQSSDKYQSSVERLSSGNRIVRPGDDPSGLAIAGGIDAEISSHLAAQKNALEGRSLSQVKENGLNQISDMLTRIRELAVSASNDCLEDEGRDAISAEYGQLRAEIDRVAQSTGYRGISLLNGQGGTLSLLVGTDNSDFNRVSFDPSATNATSGSLGVDNLDFSDAGSAQDSLESIDNAMKQVQGMRAENGGLQARMNSIAEGHQMNADILREDVSRIRDTDVAKESSELLKQQLAQNAQVAVLAQTNSLNSSILRLVQGA